MLDFDLKKLKFKFNGEDNEIEYPTVKKINQFRKALKADGADEVDCTIEFLCELGAKKEVVESLRISQLNALVSELTLEDAKKK